MKTSTSFFTIARKTFQLTLLGFSFLSLTNHAQASDDPKPMISNGFYMNVGLGAPAFTSSGIRFGIGSQLNFELGNQWMFVKEPTYGIGMKMSWFQLGFGRKAYEFSSGSSKALELRLFRVGPMATFALGKEDKMAIDGYVDVSPTILAQWGTNLEGAASAGALVTPGARFRYKTFAVGLDLGFGRLTRVASEGGSGSIGFRNTRLYVGFKF